MRVDLFPQVIVGGLPIGVGQQERSVVLLQLVDGRISMEAALLHLLNIERLGEAVEGEEPQQQGKQQDQGEHHDKLPHHMTTGRQFIVSKHIH